MIAALFKTASNRQNEVIIDSVVTNQWLSDGGGLALLGQPPRGVITVEQPFACWPQPALRGLFLFVQLTPDPEGTCRVGHRRQIFRSIPPSLSSGRGSFIRVLNGWPDQRA